MYVVHLIHEEGVCSPYVTLLQVWLGLTWQHLIFMQLYAHSPTLGRGREVKKRQNSWVDHEDRNGRGNSCNNDNKIVMIKEHAKQMMRSAIAHHLPTSAQLFPEQQQPPVPAPPLLLFSAAPYGI